MPITCNTKGVWSIDDVHKKVNSGTGFWKSFSYCNSPGNLYMWGNGVQGALGNGTNGCQSSPVQIPGTTWVNVSQQSFSTISTKKDGTLWTWGGNSYGQLGVGDRTHRSSPVQVPGTQWTSVSASYNNVMHALKSDNTLWVWGNNNWQVIGTNDGGGHRSSPNQIPGSQWSCLNHKQGAQHSSALKLDGTWWVWGLNAFGSTRINCNTGGDISSPVQIPGTWCQISSLAGPGNMGAIKTDGTLWKWGNNSVGLAGDNSTVHRSSPVQVPGTQWVETAAGNYHTYGRKTDGTLWAWGLGCYGQLANNNPAAVSSPVQIPGTQWTSIRAGKYNGIATKTDGTLWVWGENNNVGNLGIGSVNVHRSSPIQIPGTFWVEGSMSLDETSGAAIRV